MHAVRDQPIDVPSQFRLVDLAAAVQGHKMGSEDAMNSLTHLEELRDRTTHHNDG